MQALRYRPILPVIGAKCKVLDHGHVILTHAMPGFFNPKDPLGAERMILDAARTSTNLDTMSKKNNGVEVKYDYDRDVKLLKYLMLHKHWSPFEQIQIQFHFNLPIFVNNQLKRYRTAAINEQSFRYSMPSKPKVYVPDRSRLCAQSKTNKQASSNEIIADEGVELFYNTIKKSLEIYDDYETSVKEYGLSREIARITNPQNIYINLVYSMNLRNILNLIGQRTHSTAQHEIRVYAFAIYNLVKQIAPITLETYLETDLFSTNIPASSLTTNESNNSYQIDCNLVKEQVNEINALKRDFETMLPEIEYEYDD